MSLLSILGLFSCNASVRGENPARYAVETFVTEGGHPVSITLIKHGTMAISYKGISIHVDAVPAYNYTEGHTQFHPKGRDNGFVLTKAGWFDYCSGQGHCLKWQAVK